MTSAFINTAKAPRRTLAIASFAELRLELDRIARAHAAGTLKYTGNFEGGPIFMHLALPIRYAVDGFPMMAPWPIRVLANLVLLPMIKRKPFSPGFKLGRKTQAQIFPQEVSFADGLGALQTEVQRVEAGQQMTKPHAFFGPMPHDDWVRYNLKHADLHLGFLEPGETR